MCSLQEAVDQAWFIIYGSLTQHELLYISSSVLQIHNIFRSETIIKYTNTKILVSLIRDKSVTTQNLGFLSYWYRKKRLQMHSEQV